jgi:Protein of unknown function (DUF3096)
LATVEADDERVYSAETYVQWLVANLTNIWHLPGEVAMNISLSIGPVVSLIAGILILVVPRLLNIIVAIYLIIIGLLGLFGAGYVHLH